MKTKRPKRSKHDRNEVSVKVKSETELSDGKYMVDASGMCVERRTTDKKSVWSASVGKKQKGRLRIRTESLREETENIKNDLGRNKAPNTRQKQWKQKCRSDSNSLILIGERSRTKIRRIIF